MPGIAVRFRVVEAEQLIGAVDEVNLHGPDSPTSTRGKMHGMTERVPLTDLPIEDCVDDARCARRAGAMCRDRRAGCGQDDDPAASPAR